MKRTCLKKWFLLVLVINLVSKLFSAVTLPQPTITSATVGTVVKVYGEIEPPLAYTCSELWLEVRRPDGQWSWEGWLTGEPWGPKMSPYFFTSSTNKSGEIALTIPGTYYFRASAFDVISNSYITSAEKSIVVSGTTTTPTVVQSNSTNVRKLGTSIAVAGSATDSDGTMTEHWLEVKRPNSQWSWEGWLTGEPWGPLLNGSSYSSNKSATFTFNQGTGTYTFRTTAYEPATNTYHISNETNVRVIYQEAGSQFKFLAHNGTGMVPTTSYPTGATHYMAAFIVHGTGLVSLSGTVQQNTPGATVYNLPSSGGIPEYRYINHSALISNWPSLTPYGLKFIYTYVTSLGTYQKTIITSPGDAYHSTFDF